MGERLTAVCSAAQDSSLLVVGPGVLGSYAGILWQQQHPGARVIGQTNSQSNHDRQAEQYLWLLFAQQVLAQHLSAELEPCCTIAAGGPQSCSCQAVCLL